MNITVPTGWLLLKLQSLEDKMSIVLLLRMNLSYLKVILSVYGMRVNVFSCET